MRSLTYCLMFSVLLVGCVPDSPFEMADVCWDAAAAAEKVGAKLESCVFEKDVCRIVKEDVVAIRKMTCESRKPELQDRICDYDPQICRMAEANEKIVLPQLKDCPFGSAWESGFGCLSIRSCPEPMPCPENSQIHHYWGKSAFTPILCMCNDQNRNWNR